MELNKSEEYTPFTRQMTLYINSDDRDYGSAIDFYMTIPNPGLIVPNSQINLTCVQFGTNLGNPLVGATEANPIQLRSNIGSNNVIESDTKSIANILLQVPRNVAGGNDFWNYQNYDKTYYSIRTSEFFGKQVRFYLTDALQREITGGFTNIYFVLQIFY